MGGRAISLEAGPAAGWRWRQGAGGGLAWLSWLSPKPVTPRHLETITGNNEGSRGPGCVGLWPCLFRGAEELRTSRLLRPPPPPPLFALALPHSSQGPGHRERSVPEPQRWGLVARLRAHRSGDSDSAPCPVCKTPLSAHCGGSLGLSFPTGSSNTTSTRLGAYHVLARCT